MLEFTEETKIIDRDNSFQYQDALASVEQVLEQTNEKFREVTQVVQQKNSGLIPLVSAAFINSCLKLSNSAKILGDMAGYGIGEILSADVSPCKCRIVEEESSTRVVFDALIPKKIKYIRNKNADVSNIYATYLADFYRKVGEKKRRIFNEAVVIEFINHFCCREDMVDHDNFDYSAFLDAISAAFLIDDGPLYCSYFMDSITDTRNYSEFIILPRKQFMVGQIRDCKL